MVGTTQILLKIKQSGNLLTVSDGTDTWETDHSHVACVVTFSTGEGEYEVMKDNTDASKDFHVEFETEYHILLMDIQNWIHTTTYTTGDVVTYSGKVYQATGSTTNQAPPLYPSVWTELSASDIYNMTYSTDNTLIAFVNYTTSSEDENDDCTITKTADHTFSIKFTASSYSVSSVEVYDYNDTLIDTITPSSSEFEVVFDEDKIYYLKIEDSNGDYYYCNIYDFTDTEKCYLKLVEEVMCECVDCNNCEGKKYKKALTIMNAYNFLRDYIFSNDAVNAGITDASSLRSDWLRLVGVLFDKLILLTSNCDCDD